LAWSQLPTRYRAYWTHRVEKWKAIDPHRQERSSMQQRV
jgi:hypothetical protein